MSARDIDQGVETLLAADDLLETLTALAYLRRCINQEINETVTRALQVHTGADVGRALGVTRQQISRRYSPTARTGAATPVRP